MKRNSQFADAKKTINGFDPAGGWGTRSSCMRAKAVANDSAILHHCGPIKWKNNNPINVATRCPPITLRG